MRKTSLPPFDQLIESLSTRDLHSFHSNWYVFLAFSLYYFSFICVGIPTALPQRTLESDLLAKANEWVDKFQLLIVEKLVTSVLPFSFFSYSLRRGFSYSLRHFSLSTRFLSDCTHSSHLIYYPFWLQLQLLQLGQEGVDLGTHPYPLKESCQWSSFSWLWPPEGILKNLESLAATFSFQAMCFDCVLQEK